MALSQGRRIEPAVSTIGRLKRRPDFLAAAGGRRFHTEHMTAQGRLRDAAPAAAQAVVHDGLRIGFTITKRVGHATERNRIRRRLRDAVARASDDLPGTAADIVLVARRPALHAPFETLIADLRRAVGAVTKPQGAKSSGAKASGAKGGDTASTGGRRRSGKGAPILSASTRSPATEGASASLATPGFGVPMGGATGGAATALPSPNTRDGSLDG